VKNHGNKNPIEDGVHYEIVVQSRCNAYEELFSVHLEQGMTKEVIAEFLAEKNNEKRG